jgi:acetyl esterase/lipase
MARPENFGEGPLPAIVIVHGGGWRAGSKQVGVYRRLLLDYAFQGYVALSVEYRLDDEAAFPACVEDVKCAVRWLRAHARDYNIDPNRIGAYGHSAGAHIVLMLAMCPPTAGLEGDGGWNDYSSEVQVAIGGSTPVEPNERMQEWKKSEWWPVGYISKDVPPLLLIHGVQDDLVDIKTVDAFVDNMKSAGANIEYIRIEEGNHGVAYTNNLEITGPSMNGFFAKYLMK